MEERTVTVDGIAADAFLLDKKSSGMLILRFRAAGSGLDRAALDEAREVLQRTLDSIGSDLRVAVLDESVALQHLSAHDLAMLGLQRRQ